MKDTYSLDADEEGLDSQYRAALSSLLRIFRRCGLPVIAVGADVGMMGGSLAHEFMYLTPIGEDTLVLCDHCGYSANRQIARFRKPIAERRGARDRWRRSPRPATTTIEALARLLEIPDVADRQGRLPGRHADRRRQEARFVFAVVRGDMDVNETKLANVVKANELRPAREEEIRAIGAEPGYGSPIGVQGRARRRRRPHPGLAQPGRRRERGRLPLPQRQLRPRLSGRHRRRHAVGAGRRRLPALRRPAADRARRRGRQHLQARHALHRGASARPSWTRTASGSRSSWAPTASASGGCWPASPRSTATSTG